MPILVCELWLRGSGTMYVCVGRDWAVGRAAAAGESKTHQPSNHTHARARPRARAREPAEDEEGD